METKQFTKAQQDLYNEYIMDKKIKTIIPSLQDMALIKISTSLWNERKVRLKLSLSRVKANIQRLHLPLSFRRRLDSITCPMREQILSWLRSGYAIYCSRPMHRHLFCWTSQGTLDPKTTVKGVLRIKNITVFDRFRMACRCCLESEIHSLWERIDKNSLHPSQILLLLSSSILNYWTFQMDPNINRLPQNGSYTLPSRCSNLLSILQDAVADKNFLAVKYFSPKLTTEEKKKFWSDFSSNVFKDDCDYISEEIFHFVFSSMDQEYQNELLRKYPYRILFMFREWPWQSHFLEYSKLCWNFLSLQEFQKLLKIILDHPKDSWGHRLYYYKVLFEEFWIESPISFKRFMVNYEFKDLFSCLDDTDEDKILLFLKHLSLEERKIIIFSDCGMETCRYYFFGRKRLVIFRRFVAECLYTAESVVNFREDFGEFVLAYIRRRVVFEIEKNALLSGVDVIFDSLLKKRSDEENGS